MRGSRVAPGVRGRMESPWTLGILGCIGYLLVITSFRLPTAIPFIALALVGILVRVNTLRVSGSQGMLVLFAIWASISTIGSPYRQEALDGLLLFGKVAVIAIMIAWSIRSREQLLILLTAYLLCFLAFPVRGTLFSYYLYKGGFFSGYGSLRAMWGYSFANPNDLAAYCLLAIGLTATLGLLTPHRWLRRLAVAGIGLLLVVIMLTQSRSGLLGLVSLVVAAVWAFRLHRSRTFWLVAAGGLGILLLVTPRAALDRYLGLSKLTNISTVREADPEGSADQRLEILRVAVAITRDSPVFGVGVGAYSRAHLKYATQLGFRRTAMGQRDAHNSYLRLAAETGLPGLGIFLFSMALTIRETLRARRRFPRGSAEFIALTMLNLTWIGYGTCALFGSLTSDSYTYVQLGFCWAATRVLEGPDRVPIGRSLRRPTRSPSLGRDLHHVPVT